MLTRLRDYANGRSIILLKDVTARSGAEERVGTIWTIGFNPSGR